MRPALLLIDLQQDYLNRPGLEPPAPQLVSHASSLLDICRQSAIPVFHAVTQVHADGSNRMPHWRASNHWACVEETRGVLPPDEVAPLPDEAIFTKLFFNAFDNPALAAALAADGIDTLIVAGLYTHACVRATVLDAYSRGYAVWVAADAVASTDPLHARLTLDYLEGRAAHCLGLTEIASRLAALRIADHGMTHPQKMWLHRNPGNWDEVLTEVPLGQARDVAEAVLQVRSFQKEWERTNIAARIEKLAHWMECLNRKKEQFITLLMREIGKPLLNAQAEFDYATALLRHTLHELANDDLPLDATNCRVRYCPVGTVGLITPWNNPLAIPVGKLAPALAYANTAVWKPALQATQLSRLVMESLQQAGLGDAVALVTGDADTGSLLLARKEIATISFTGSIAAGRQVAAVCAAEGKTLQAELGGNNAAIIMADVDPEKTAQMLARSIFSFSGQRCTAPRRLIVEAVIMHRFERALVAATAALKLGCPEEEGVQVGPLISRQQQSRMATLTSAGIAAGGRVLCGGKIPEGYAHGCWFEPTLIADVHPDSPLVQEESFGPIAVIMAARNPGHALALCNSVPHGLVTTLFSNDAGVQRRVMEEAQCGIIAINQSPLDIDPAAPFGGWKASGIGLPEHGRWDHVFYTKPQAIYG